MVAPAPEKMEAMVHHPTPTPTPLPQKLGFKWGVWGGPDPKLVGGCVYWIK